MASTKPMPVIGVDKYTFFKVTEETTDGITYGDSQSLPGTVQISPTDSGNTFTFDADNIAYASMGYLESVGHELTNADIPPEVDALWRGLELNSDGSVTVTNNSTTPYFGVAWRTKKVDGTYRYVKYYKGTYAFASNVGGQTQPSSGAPEAQTSAATYTAAARLADGAYYTYMDQTDIPEGVTVADFEEGWFGDMSYSPSAA